MSEEAQYHMPRLSTAAATAVGAAQHLGTAARLSARHHDMEQHTDSSAEEDVDSDADDDRAGSHAAAAAGPSSAAAARGKQSSSKKRPAGVAFKDAVSLLPADLDEAMIKRTLQQLQPRNRMQKQALLQGYRAQFSHWRLLLRCVGILMMIQHGHCVYDLSSILSMWGASCGSAVADCSLPATCWAQQSCRMVLCRLPACCLRRPSPHSLLNLQTCMQPRATTCRLCRVCPTAYQIISLLLVIIAPAVHACRQHFSLLFYGFGSKQALLEQFAQEKLTDGGVLACYGHQPGMSSKQLLQAVAGALTHRSCKGSSHSELLRLICAEPACRKLYVIVHNIDGPGELLCGTVLCDVLWLELSH